MFDFFKRQMSDSDGTPSNNRVMAFLILTTTMAMIVAATVAPAIGVLIGEPKLTFALPVIPDSFANLVEWLVTVLVSGVVLGHGVNAYRDVKSGSSSSSSSVTEKTEVTKGQ